jgi:hypothetical protein
MRAAVILAVVAASIAGGAGCGACEPDRPEDAVASASASSAPSAPPPAGSAPGIGSALVPHPVRLACRAIELVGDVHI